VLYESYVDKSMGFWTVHPGEPPAVLWELHEAYQSEAYKLAVAWIDLTGSSIAKRRVYHSTLSDRDKLERVVHWLLYDIPTDATSTAEALWSPAFATRRPKNGTSSWAAPSAQDVANGRQWGALDSFSGPCTYPLGYPPFGMRSKYEIKLYIYRTNYHRQFTTPVTLANFEKAMGTGQKDVAGTCAFYPVSFVRQRQDKKATPGNLPLTSSSATIPQCDGKYKSTTCPEGAMNASWPCGAYGCECKYSPGNCMY
jgi:phosphatidylethanolamine-binding protein (PEBP) family uncharacterized protein